MTDRRDNCKCKILEKNQVIIDKIDQKDYIKNQ